MPEANELRPFMERRLLKPETGPSAGLVGDFKGAREVCVVLAEGVSVADLFTAGVAVEFEVEVEVEATGPRTGAFFLTGSVDAIIILGTGLGIEVDVDASVEDDAVVVFEL